MHSSSSVVYKSQAVVPTADYLICKLVVRMFSDHVFHRGLKEGRICSGSNSCVYVKGNNVLGVEGLGMNSLRMVSAFLGITRKK